MAEVRFMDGGDVGEVAPIEQVTTADPFAQSTSKALQPQIAVEQHLDRAMSDITPDQASEQLALGHVRDARVVAAYKAIESGAHLVDLASLFQDARPYETFPKLALAPADRFGDDIRVTVTKETTTFHSKKNPRKGWNLTLPLGGPMEKDYSWQMRETVVPLIPDSVMDHMGGDLKGRLLFWEPAKWVGGDQNRKSILSRKQAAEKRISSIMDAMRNFDPALLEPVSGTLYRVVAAWDLSPLEIAALAR